MNIFGNLKEKIAQAIDVRFRLVKLSLIESVSKVLSYFIFTFIGLFIGFAILLFLGFGLAEVFKYYTGSYIAGYFITVGLYILLLLLVFLLGKNIMNGFTSIFIRMLTEQDEKEPEDEKEATAK